MLHGKKMFERIVWAFNNVLNSAVTWLFQDLQAQLGALHTGKAATPATVVRGERTAKSVLTISLQKDVEGLFRHITQPT